MLGSLLDVAPAFAEPTIYVVIHALPRGFVVRHVVPPTGCGPDWYEIDFYPSASTLSYSEAWLHVPVGYRSVDRDVTASDSGDIVTVFCEREAVA